MNIYIASKTKHAAKWKALRSEGYSIISTWIDEGESPDKCDLAARCIQEITSCDALLFYGEPGEHQKGSLVEIGAALAAEKPIYCVGFCLPDTSAFRSHPLWNEHETIEQALVAMSIDA